MAAKQMVFDDEARAPGGRRRKVGPRCSQHARPPRPQRRARQGLGLAQGDQGRRHRRRRHRARRPLRKPRRKLVKEAASKTNDVAGDGTTTATVLAEGIFREGLKMIAAGDDPMALSRGINKAVTIVNEAIDKQAESVDVKDKKSLQQIATIAGNNDPSNRQRAGRRLHQGRQRRRHHGRRRPQQRNDGRSRRRHAVRSRLPLAPLRHQSGRARSRVRELPDPGLTKKRSRRQELWCRFSKRFRRPASRC